MTAGSSLVAEQPEWAHTGATLAAQAGGTLAELMNRLGHTTVTAALIYQHVAARDAEIARRLSAIAREAESSGQHEAPNLGGFATM